jgi:DNA polymerase III subunit gamma/tau
MDRMLELIDQFAAAESRMKWAPNKKLHFEIAVIKAIHTLQQTTLSEVIDTLATLRSGGEVKLPAKSHTPSSPAPALHREPTPVPTAKPQAVEAAPAVASPEKIEPVQPVAAENFWPEFLRLVRSKRQLVSPWVETGALLKLEGELCLVGFPKSQSLAMESLQRPNNKKFLEEIAANLAGHPVVIKFVVRDGLVVEPQPAPEPPPPPPTDEELKEKKNSEFVNDPLIKKALELFEAEIVST